MRRACRGLARLARAATIGGMKEVGRLLQIVALAVLPLSIVLEYSGQLGRRWGVSDMVVMVDPVTGQPLSGSIMSSTENQSMPKIEVGID